MHFIRHSCFRIAKGTLSTFSCDRPQNAFQPTEQYILGPSGEELTMLDGSGNWQRTNIYGGGALLATPISVKRDEQPNPAYPSTQGAPPQIPMLPQANPSGPSAPQSLSPSVP